MISSLVFCDEFTYENKKAAEMLLKLAGKEKF